MNCRHTAWCVHGSRPCSHMDLPGATLNDVHHVVNRCSVPRFSRSVPHLCPTSSLHSTPNQVGFREEVGQKLAWNAKTRPGAWIEQCRAASRAQLAGGFAARRRASVAGVRCDSKVTASEKASELLRVWGVLPYGGYAPGLACCVQFAYPRRRRGETSHLVAKTDILFWECP